MYLPKIERNLFHHAKPFEVIRIQVGEDEIIDALYSASV
jgi:hypothetical protein